LAREEDFVAKPFPSLNAPTDGIADSPEARAGLRGALIRKFIDVGSPVTADDILRPRDRGFIASVLEKGTRAATIGVDPITGVAGLVWPGDHVDVLLTQSVDRAPPDRKAFSETVLSNVRVIAIDQDMMQGASGDNTTAGKLARTVTLQVDPEQAQMLTVAAKMGTLSLSIRSAVDQTQAVTMPTYSADVSHAVTSNNPPTGTVVKVIEAGKSREVTFP
jgi:pilus assembly protein CpaB